MTFITDPKKTRTTNEIGFNKADHGIFRDHVSYFHENDYFHDTDFHDCVDDFDNFDVFDATCFKRFLAHPLVTQHRLSSLTVRTILIVHDFK